MLITQAVYHNNAHYTSSVFPPSCAPLHKQCIPALLCFITQAVHHNNAHGYAIPLVVIVMGVIITVPFRTHPAPSIPETVCWISHFPVPKIYIFVPFPLNSAGLLALFSANWALNGREHHKREMGCNAHVVVATCRVGQNHIYTVYIRYFWQGNRQIYGYIQCICTVLANLSYLFCCPNPFLPFPPNLRLLHLTSVTAVGALLALLTAAAAGCLAVLAHADGAAWVRSALVRDLVCRTSYSTC